ncbi:MAG: peptidoglycan-binding protein [Clostridia bacterium]|nr:peptidoglycan-binding protein [Clostridia bacterium]
MEGNRSNNRTAGSSAGAVLGTVWQTVQHIVVTAAKAIGAWAGRLWKRFRAQSLDRQRMIAASVVFVFALLLFIIALSVGVSACRRGNAVRAAVTESDEAAEPIERAMPEPDEALSEAESAWIEAEPALPEALSEPEAQAEAVAEGNAAAAEQQTVVIAAEPTAEPLVLKKHDERDEVLTLQKRLIKLGYLEIDEPTNYYGSATEYAVKLFQRQHGLEMDGVAGTQTLELLYSGDAQKYTLKEGAEGRDVKMLQEQLVDLGYLSSSQVDSVYGAITTEAVMAFQKRNKLTADGKAGEKTLDKLYSDDAKISESLEAKQKAEAEEAERKAKEEAAKQKAEEQKAKEAEKKAQEQSSKEKRIDKFISAATSKIGCEYVLGDRGPNSFDCSGFVYYCLRQAGVSVTRLSASGYSKKSDWKEIKSISDLQRGDILFFRSDDSKSVSHTGIYIGGGMMIDASSGNGKVVKRSLSNYWKRNFVNARRPW